MNRKRILSLLLFISTTIACVKCDNESKQKERNPPYFRRKVEELGDADFFERTGTEDHQNLVSFLVKNVKEIFNDLIDTSDTTASRENALKKIKTDIEFISNSTITAPRRTKCTVTLLDDIDSTGANISRSSKIPIPTHTSNQMVYQNLPFTSLLVTRQKSKHVSREDKNKPKNGQMPLPREMYSKPYIKARDIVGLTLTGRNDTESDGEGDPRRSCIMCNNVETEECNDPKNKLISSVMCDHDDDLCYSLHTPFGIIDRGCFNVNHNLTTYVCSCNLCNYISISDMPFIFSKKRDWVDNVIELSRTRHFRKSVFKDMSCLRCEVNTTTKTGDMLDSANCLEGNIGNIPVEECNMDEVCAVTALRADGYIWRGCVKAPLYNYWWTVCDRDLCNYDAIVTLHDFII